MTKSIATFRMLYRKSTEHTHQYKESPATNYIGTLYLNKGAVIGEPPKQITVTITAA